MGVSGSGKTTVGEALANRLGYGFADADDYHSAQNKAKMHAGLPLSDEDRLPWLAVLQGEICRWLNNGTNTVLACSALKEEYRQILIHDPKRTIIIFLDASFDLLSERLAKRNHPFMNSSLLESQLKTLEKPHAAILLDASLPVEKIVDSACNELAPRLRTINT